MRPVVYRVTSKLPAMHDWRLHKLSIGTTSPGQSVRALEMLGTCQRTPPAFPSRNSTTNDPRVGRATTTSARFRLDGVAPLQCDTVVAASAWTASQRNGSFCNGSGSRACRCDAAGAPQSQIPVLPSDTDARREPHGRGGGLKITCRDHPIRTCGMNGGTGHHGSWSPPVCPEAVPCLFNDGPLQVVGISPRPIRHPIPVHPEARCSLPESEGR